MLKKSVKQLNKFVWPKGCKPVEFAAETCCFSSNSVNTFKNRLDRYWGHFQYQLEKFAHTHTEDTGEAYSSRQ